MNIILFGFKSCGKTHLGKLLSKALKCPFIDTDDLIVELYKKEFGKALPVHQIHEILTDTGFRILEKTAIYRLPSNSNTVIALGGGVVLDSDNVSYLQKIGQLIYLKASFNTIKHRILSNKIPSFIDSANPIQSLKKTYEDRLPIYESISAKCIDIDLVDELHCITALRSMNFLEEPS